MIITDVLNEAILTNEEREQTYRDGYKVQAKILKALFPHGINPKDQEEWERFTFVFMLTLKLTRYCVSITDNGIPHPDSIHDLGVYAFMLQQFDKDNG